MTRPNRYQKLRQQGVDSEWLRVRIWYRSIKVGEMVLLKEDNVTPLKWRLERIIKLYRGPDNLTKVVDFAIAKGIVRRALNKLVILPTCDVESNGFQGGQDVKAVTRRRRTPTSIRNGTHPRQP
ncbi:hypothetical protein EVAR_59193_1 [Eumeta japonica]|uniref:DUF5641 domain-containing protein n=1 Tax=Eumeta variegata TaxID=151549 RepID=A0A4C1ZCS8_EUMVA|nr:hypothetical protein EVAR_59193_1 [Eumeta japonica]